MRNFKESEFVMGRVNVFDKMDSTFLILLDQLRDNCNIPLKLNSTYRNPEHNKAVGGAPHSMHLLGKAADIKCNEPHIRAIIVREALFLGLSVGIAKTFIHVDSRESQVVFTY